ncbi:ATP-binding protein [Riemerella anatipestifer]|uniref:ATP-binding protein n=1 Tax=Riemerella anatipestifer TaxID=34085 RepID=UPI001374D91C|nr:ATP-binding protein [Riemerella anatipestifer]MDY3522008.1 ATP-binding protein [Riemerella anatipestifer]MDY3534261.1 ATP-binding protein [Riemerella anatipestifer]MDY3536325.1 ATP-binding protein [Riemerella anatipestifer]
MNRNKLIQHIELWKAKLGSYSKVAQKCGISVGTLSTIMARKYGADESNMLGKIAAALDYKDSKWTIVRTIGNYRRIAQAVEDAKTEKMWFAVSNKAGSCKTVTLEDIYNQDTTGSVVLIQAEEWSARQFLMQLIAKTIGIVALKGEYKTNSELLQMVADYFNEQVFNDPILLIDEADKLRPAALRLFIPLFNKTEDRLGVVISGTENLQKEIRQGVRLAKKGYDEIDSRIGRSYIELKGATEKEVYQICEANGITDELTQESIWNRVEKIKKITTVRTKTGTKEKMIDYAEDFRRIKRLVKREVLLKKRAKQ